MKVTNNKKQTVAGYKCFEEKLDKRLKGIKDDSSSYIREGRSEKVSEQAAP